MVKWPDGQVTRLPEWLFVEKLPQSCIVRNTTNPHFCSAMKAVYALKIQSEMEARLYQRKKRMLALLFAGLLLLAFFM
jgi:hypothetical protein